MVFTDWEGRRLIYVQAGVNERLAEELRTRDLEESLFDHMRQSRVVHISSFTGTAERTLQEGLVSQLDGQTVLTFTPGALYSALGADRLNTILRRTNVLFLYEQQLDRLLARSSAGENLDGAELTQKMARLYEWRRHRGSQEPMAVIIKRPAHLARGAMEEYLSIGYGRDRLEDLGGADAGIRSFEVIDSTGAGDALAAGFIRSLFEQSLPGECGNLAFVMALSASSVQGGRRGLPHSNQLRDCWRRYLPAVLVPKWLPPSQ